MGDTRLFAAAVLPVVVVGRNSARPGSLLHVRQGLPGCRPEGDRSIFRSEPSGDKSRELAEKWTSPRTCQGVDHHGDSILDALADRTQEGIVKTAKGVYRIERGSLLPSRGDEVWCLSTAGSEAWLKTVKSHQACTFGDLGDVRVGIKTTADSVFIRDDWAGLPAHQQPEHSLLRPLITHLLAARWLPQQAPGATRVLYPHTTTHGRRTASSLPTIPGPAITSTHRSRLEGRRYVIRSRRRWYEIWVPHCPADWAKLQDRVSRYLGVAALLPGHDRRGR